MQQIPKDNPAPLNLGGMELTVRDTLDYMQTLNRENKVQGVYEVTHKNLQLSS